MLKPLLFLALFFIAPIPIFFAIYFFGRLALYAIFDFTAEIFHRITKGFFR
jgi:hypothetical protein